MINLIDIPKPELESSIFSLGSIEGILIIIGVIFIIKYASKKAVDMAIKICGFILIFQILYLVGCSPLDNYIKISTVFKYDIFSALAQLVPGTFLAKILTTMGYYLSQFMADIINWLMNIPNLFLGAFKSYD